MHSSRCKADRLKWVDEGYEMLVLTDECLRNSNPGIGNIHQELTQTDLLVIVAVRDRVTVQWLRENKVKGNMFGRLLSATKKDESVDAVKTVSDAWKRRNSDDIRFCLLVIINAYIKPVPILEDPRKALQCLNGCFPTDQVSSYRCIASYESPYLEAFSLCALEKHNCLALDAEISDKPYVPPLSTFRGEGLTHEIAEDLFVGWLGTLEWSWRVIAGQNPAHDQFPCQHQLFYRGKARGSFWYEPVFQIRTLEGDMIWRRRRYRVKRAQVPGTFFFTVLDNGVVSKEFWTIVDVADDLSWGLFHYSGAARAAGQSYVGAVLVSPDGRYPAHVRGEELTHALERCGIKEWELYTVDNCSCSNAPLGIPDGSGLHARIEVAAEGQ